MYNHFGVVDKEGYLDDIEMKIGTSIPQDIRNALMRCSTGELKYLYVRICESMDEKVDDKIKRERSLSFFEGLVRLGNLKLGR